MSGVNGEGGGGGFGEHRKDRTQGEVCVAGQCARINSCFTLHHY